MSNKTKNKAGFETLVLGETENRPVDNQSVTVRRDGPKGPARAIASSRRNFLKGTTALTAAGAAYWLGPKLMFRGKAYADALPAGGGVVLSDPALQPKFTEPAPNALDPGFKYIPSQGKYRVQLKQISHQTGLIHPRTKERLATEVWGYGSAGIPGPGVSWPGPTFEVKSLSAGGGSKAGL